jgi:mannosyltransferase
VRRSTGWWLGLLLLLAFGLRVYNLDGQSMWSDEGLSLYRARLPATLIVENVITVDGHDTQDTNPPFYFLLLHGWRRLGGESVFGLRYLGVLSALLTVPFLYQLGRQAGGRQTGMLAALFLAISPFHVWQSQDLRNYGLLVFLTAASVYGLFRYVLAAPPRPRRWLMFWAVMALLAVYTHYFAFFVLAFALLALLLSRSGRHGRWLWPALLLVGLAMLPILPVAAARFQAGQQIDFVYVRPDHLLSHAVSVYSVGMKPAVVQSWWRILPVLLLFFAGLGAGLLPERRRPITLLLLAYLVLPLLLLMALSTVNPLYNGPRHLILGLPPFLLLAAVGGAALWRYRRPAGLLLVTVVVVSQAAWLHTQFTAPDLIKDDVRGAARYLTEVVQPGDVVILHDSLIGFTFDYYYKGPVPWRAVPRFTEQDPEAAARELATAVEDAERVWFLVEPTPRTGFPRHYLVEWADSQWPYLERRHFPALWLGVALTAYDPRPERPLLPESATPWLVDWPDGVRLNGFELPAAVAGEWWRPAFYWSRTGSAAPEFTVALRLTDEQGQVWSQLDIPLWPTLPPSAWPEESLLRQAQPVRLPWGLPPGRYQAWLRLVRVADGQPLTASEGQTDILLLPELWLAAPVPPAEEVDLPVDSPTWANFGREIALVGYRLPDGLYRPGHVLFLDLYWRARRPPTADYRVRLQLVDKAGRIVAEEVTAMSRSDYLATRWPPGAYVMGKASLLIPATATAGAHTVELALLPPDGERPLAVNGFFSGHSVVLGEAEVAPWPMATELPQLPSTLRADFGENALIEFHGFSLPETAVTPGSLMSVTLYWRANANVDANYAVFVHVVDDDNQIVAQVDGLPARGFRPTPGWRAGEVIVDNYDLWLPPDILPAFYSVWIGLYDPDTWLRAPVQVRGLRQPDDRLLLAPVRIDVSRN